MQLDHHYIERSFQPHWHEFYELFLITEGSGTHLRNGQVELIRPDALALLTPLDLHGFRAVDDCDGLRLTNVVFTAAAVTDGVAQMAGEASRTVLHLSAEQRDGLVPELDRLDRELTDRNVGWRVAARGTLERILVDVRRWAGDPPPAPGGRLPLPSEPISAPIRAALAVLEDEFAHSMTLGEVAARVHLSPAYLSDLFRREVGQPLSVYRRELRLRRAASLLAGTDLPVTEVCHRAGFVNPAHFARAFREAIGVSPSAYRERHRGPAQ